MVLPVQRPGAPTIPHVRAEIGPDCYLVEAGGQLAVLRTAPGGRCVIREAARLADVQLIDVLQWYEDAAPKCRLWGEFVDIERYISTSGRWVVMAITPRGEFITIDSMADVDHGLRFNHRADSEPALAPSEMPF